MAPGSIFHDINVPSTSYFCRHLFCNLYFPIYTTKIPKIFILLSLSDLTFASGREGIDNPFITLVARFLFVCVGTRDLHVASYWIDTLVLKTKGNIYATLLHHPFLFKGKPMHAQEVAQPGTLPQKRKDDEIPFEVTVCIPCWTNQLANKFANNSKLWC